MAILTRPADAPTISPNARAAELKEAGGTALGTLQDVVARLQASDPALASQLAGVQQKLSELGIDLGAAIATAAQSEAKATGDLTSRIPEMKTKLDAEIGKQTWSGFDGKAKPYEVANIHVNAGTVYIQQDFHWSQHAEMAKFDELVKSAMAKHFPGVPFQTIGNGLE